MADDPIEHATTMLRAARGGDPAAVERLMTAFLPRVRRIVAARMGRHLQSLAEVDDIVQVTLLDLFAGLGSCEHPSIGAFHLWLARCVERNLADQGRAAAARRRGAGRVRVFADSGDSSLLRAVPDTVTSPSRGAGAGELDRRLEDALLALRPDHREVVVLRVLCGLSFAEIAAEMGHGKPDLARAWFARAIRQLRARLDGMDAAEPPA